MSVSLEQSEFPGMSLLFESIHHEGNLQKKPVIGHAITRFDNGYLLYKIESNHTQNWVGAKGKREIIADAVS